MKLSLLGLSALCVAAAALFLTGCGRTTSDEQEITSLLNSSGYTSADNEKGYGSEDSLPSPGGNGPFSDDPQRIPFVRFRRYIPPGGVSRQITVDIPAYPGWPDTTALATITADVHGELRTLFDTTSNPILVWRKPFHDRAVRTVFLTRDQDGWHIRKVSPLAFSTQNPAYNLAIAELKVHAASWAPADTFCITSADTMLARHDLPRFEPEDEVTVWVKVESDGDSCWTFLHHGRPRRPYRWRRAYLKTSTYEFTETWHIADEGYENRPQVRPSGHDAIGWNALWADTTAPYVAAAWGLPYIVAQPGEELPEE